MKPQNAHKCPSCSSLDTTLFRIYNTVHNGSRHLIRCKTCNRLFAETINAAMENLKTPISKVASALLLRSEGLGLRATGRVLESHKGTIARWEQRFGDQKETLMLYSFCHEFVSLTFEGDELYTMVGKRTEPSDSKGWTAVIMERASRFIVDQRCGNKNTALFKSVMKTVCKYVGRTKDLTFLSDGERRYGNMLFDLCSEVLKTGKAGRPPKTLPKGVKVRVKNKGDQKRKKGRKRPNIKQLSGNTLTRIKAWQKMKSTLTILRLKMLHQEEETALLGEKQTHTRKQSMAYNEPWMFIKSCLSG